jgi:predicted ATPase/DNA-binding CsgD family transcriptional regulator
MSSVARYNNTPQNYRYRCLFVLNSMNDNRRTMIQSDLGISSRMLGGLDGGGAMAVTDIGVLAGTLPAELTSFVGRRRELGEARRLLSAGRLLTLTGPGGVGKTRVALRLADQLRHEFPDGMFLIELDALNDPGLLAQTVATAIGLRDASAHPAATLADYLQGKRLLLVLDNCEHLVEACAALADQLLAAAPTLRVVSTSRQALGIEGEQILVIPPLSVPDSDAAAAGGLGHYDAVTLFVDRASAVDIGFRLDDRNREQIVGICQLLDGIPLAIELAAVRLRALSPSDILERLDDCFRLLTRGSRTAPSRQQTLAGAIDWSYDLCSPQEQELWARLSVFSGGFDLEAAEEVGSDDLLQRVDVLSSIAGLVDKSILIRQPDIEGQYTRYRMLETIRRFGLTHLADAPEEQAVRLRHLDYFRRLAHRYRSECFGPQQLEWIHRLLREHANVRVATEFALTTPGHASAAMEICASLWNFWFSGGFLREGHNWLERGLAADPEPTRLRAEALWTCAFLAVQLGEAELAQQMLDECSALIEQFPDVALRAYFAECSGLAALFRGEVVEAAALLRQALAGHEAVGDLLGVADSLILLAGAMFFESDPGGAEVAARCLQLCEEHGATWTKCYALWAVAVHKWRAGEHRQGIVLIQQAIRLQRAVHDWTGLAYFLEVLAWCTCGAGESERAARLLGAANAVWRLSGAKVFEAPPYLAFDEQIAEVARADIGAEKFASAFAAGRGLTIDQVIADALEEEAVPRVDRGLAPQRPEIGLTRREREIAELVAEGLTNREIAARLIISQRTAEGHVERVLAKFGFTSRAQIATWFAEKSPNE